MTTDAERLPRWLAASLAAALSLAAAPALAQDVAAAEALYAQGRELLAKGEVAQACAKLAESQRLDPSSGTALNLGLCYVRQGKTASAWGAYQVAARLARAQQKPEREKEAQTRVAELAKDLSYLTINVPTPVAGFELRRDDVRLDAGAFGAKLPVDPGPHVIRATAPGFQAFTREITIGGSRDVQVVAIPELAREGAAAPIVAAPAPVSPPPQAADAPAPKPGAGPLPWIVGGAGVALLGVGGVFGGLAAGSYGDAKDACPSRTGCSSTAIDARNSADVKANVANVTIGVGAAAVAAGVVLYIVRRPSAPPTSSSRLPTSFVVTF